MDRTELIKKAREFEKENETIIWTPYNFPEDMEDDGILDDLVSEGGNMYYSLEEALKLIHDLTAELEISQEEND